MQPETLLRWNRTRFRRFWRFRSKGKPAPIHLAPQTIALIHRMARETLTWGAERGRGELRKLGIQVEGADQPKL